MLAPIAIIIPIFLLYSRYSEQWLGFALIDTRTGLVLLYTVFALPFTVWMMYTYFRQMPPSLEEAALVDGCTRVQALRKVAWPLAAPGVVSAAAFAFIFSWTEFLFAVGARARPRHHAPGGARGYGHVASRATSTVRRAP